MPTKTMYSPAAEGHQEGSGTVTTAANGPDWSKFKYGKAMLPDDEEKRKGMPNYQGCEVLLKKVDALRPFSAATSIIDIACGPGLLYSALFASPINLNPTSALLATDISGPMLSDIYARQAEARSEDSGTWARIQAWEGDATDLSRVPDNSQSHVLSQMGIFLVPDSDKALLEARRVMKKDGTSIFAMTSVGPSTWNDDVMATITELYPEQRVMQAPRKWQQLESMRAEIERAGFVDVRVEEFDVYLAFESPKQVVDMFVDRMHSMLQQGSMTAAQEAEVKKAMRHKVETKYPQGRFLGTALIGLGF